MAITNSLQHEKVYLPTLTPAGWKLRSRACGPISHAWLKNVSCCRPAWHNFQKYVNSDPCKERKPCVKLINGNTFLAISDFWSEKHWERARPWQTSADFGHLRKTSDFFGNLRKWSCRFQKSQHSQDKNLTLISQKKLAGIAVKRLNSKLNAHMTSLQVSNSGQIMEEMNSLNTTPSLLTKTVFFRVSIPVLCN